LIGKSGDNAKNRAGLMFRRKAEDFEQLFFTGVLAGQIFRGIRGGD